MTDRPRALAGAIRIYGLRRKLKQKISRSRCTVFIPCRAPELADKAATDAYTCGRRRLKLIVAYGAGGSLAQLAHSGGQPAHGSREPQHTAQELGGWGVITCSVQQSAG